MNNGVTAQKMKNSIYLFSYTYADHILIQLRTIYSNNHMILSEIWDKFMSLYFKIFETSQVNRGRFRSFKKWTEISYPKFHKN